MPPLHLDTWPPEPILTERLLIRAPQASDRPSLRALLTSAAARRHLGGPIAPQDAEAATAGPAGRTPGCFVVTTAADSTFVGTVVLDRRDADRPGTLPDDGQALEVSYVLDPAHWGHAYASEAVAAVLGWASEALPDTHIVACTQTANRPSISLLQRLRFTKVDQFVEFDAEQSLWIRSLAAIDTPAPSR